MMLTILSVIISSVVSVILSDKIIFGLQWIFIKLGISKSSDLSGTWKATFVIGSGSKKEEYTEIIVLKNRLGTIYGNIADDKRNYNRIHEVMKRKPIRVKGVVSDNRYFTGFWYHPIETSRYHGSYQLIINGAFKYMSGQWIGYSETQQKIVNGIWKWEKLE